MAIDSVVNDSFGEHSLTIEGLDVAGKPTLREKRLAVAMSMNELATAAKLSASTVMDIERGASPRMATIRKLAKALDCAPQDIEWPGDPFGELKPPSTDES
jgi:transcriptional regulator with XRE-family HTH domain